MYIGQPITTTEVQVITGMVYHYKDMWIIRFHILYTMVEADSGPKGIAIIWKNDLEVAFRDINNMVYSETLLNYPDWTITSTVHTYASDKQLGAVTIQNEKPIALFLRNLSKPQHN